MGTDRESFEKKLAADNIRLALQLAGLFLTGWELLAGDIVDRVKAFFEIKPGSVTIEYEKDVLSRHKSPLQASALWLVENGAITDAQCKRLDDMRKHRNEIAHELSKVLVDPKYQVDITLLAEMAVILRAVGSFFGRIAMDCNSEFDGQDVKDEDIRSGTSILMDHLLRVCVDVVDAPLP